MFIILSRNGKKSFQAKFGFRSSLRFTHSNIEQLKYESNSFDLIVTRAVLEHVRNNRQMTQETHRVLKLGGRCLHSFGPLYTSFGGDHCVAAFGFENGYDHILLSEDE